MSIKDIKDITENPSKVKSNFDQMSLDENEDVFVKVLETHHTIKSDKIYRIGEYL